MSSQRVNAVEKDLEKFIKFLALKSTQVVVQSRLGEKLQTQCNPLATGNDWFNLEIQDHPDIFAETKSALALGPGISILKRLPLCVEISVKTVEGDQMVLEVWSLDVTSNGQRIGSDDNKDVTDAAMLKGVAAVTTTTTTTATATNGTTAEHQTLKAAHAIYNRMGMLLKSLISLTRVTPAYKLSRCQCPEAYGIYYRIYVDRPQMHLLGDGYKCLSIGELNTIVGTLKMELSYRTKMTISPTTGPSAAGQTRKGETNTIMLKSDHFRPIDTANSPTQKNTGLNGLAFGKKGLNGCNAAERKIVDIEKPLKPGAFVDLNKLRQYTEEDYVLPETPPFEWLLRRNRNESGCTGSIESLNRKSDSPVSSPSVGTSNNNNNNNNANNCNLNGFTNQHNNNSNSNNNNNNNSSNNNNVPTFKNFESNSEKPTSTTATTTQATLTKPSTSPAAPTTLSQSPLKSLLVPAAQNTSKRHSSKPYLPSQPPASNAIATAAAGHHHISSSEEDNLLKELNFPFASPTSHVNELAKFLRDCYHAPPLRSLTTEIPATAPAAEVNSASSANAGAVAGGGGSSSSSSNNGAGIGGCSAAAAYANVDSSDFAVIDDLSRQLEQFETSLEDYDKLVYSLTGSSSTGSRSSGGGLQMSN